MSAGEIEPLLGRQDESPENLPKNRPGPVVGFDPNGDPENPMEWPLLYKWSIIALLAFTAFTVYVVDREEIMLEPQLTKHV